MTLQYNEADIQEVITKVNVRLHISLNAQPITPWDKMNIKEYEIILDALTYRLSLLQPPHISPSSSQT